MKKTRPNFKTSSFQTAAGVGLALTILFLITLGVNAEEKGKGLSPVALKVFEHCIDAAGQNRQLTDQQLKTELRPIFDASSGSATGSFTVETEDDFECYVQVPIDSFDPKVLRGFLEAGQASNFEGRVNHCSWLVAVQGGLASVLRCSLYSTSEPANIFQVNFGIFPSQGAIFWLEPVLIYDDNGYIRLGG